MPIYEYRCDACRGQLSMLARTIDAPPPPCTRCGGAQVTRLLSRFAAPRSEEARIEAPSHPSGLGDIDENGPPRSARWMNRVGRESGDDLGDEFEEDIERAAENLSGEADPGAEAFPGATDAGASDG